MSILDRITDAFRAVDSRPPMFAEPATRSFVGGSAVVQPVEVSWGHDDSAYSPPEYLDYLSCSNNVYACVNYRANALSRLPLKLYRGKQRDTRKEVEKGKTRDLLDSVNPWMTFDRLMHLTEQYLCLMGEAFWFLERGQSGLQPPTEIWPQRPDMVKVVPSADGFVAGYLLIPVNGGAPIPYSVDEVIWLSFPNPKDPFSGLAPLAAARLAADTASAAMRSNRAIFSNGVQLGGVISPADGGAITEEQAKKLQAMFAKQFKGESKAHRVAILDYAVKFQQWTMTPKDAEFTAALDMTLEEICRAFGISPELVGAGSRTYQNSSEARYAFWADTMTAEARFVASVLTERLLPMFGEAEVAEFDFFDVDALKENEDSKWAREKEQLTAGVLLPDEWRAHHGLAAVPWGQDWWASAALTPIGGPMADEQAAKADGIANATQDGANQDGTAPRSRSARTIAYGSHEHREMWQRAIARTDPWEEKVGAVVADLMKRQRQAILARLRETERSAKRLAVKDLIETIFALPRWIRAFRETIRPVLLDVVDDIGTQELNDLGMPSIDFDLHDPNVVRAIERQAQKFATEVNQTTWDQLRQSLADGLDAGESIDDLAARVEHIMGNRIASSGDVIARTEVVRASSTGTIESWRQSGVVTGKQWLAALDDRTRDTHVEAHGQIVGIDEDFTVGGGSGPGPGNIGLAEEDINCFPGDTLVYAEDVVAATMRPYQGDVIRLTLGDGRQLTATPNHPILTPQGWVSAASIETGDDLVSYALIEDVVLAHPYPHHKPTEIAEVFRLASVLGSRHRMAGVAQQFHGDGFRGQVDIVRTHGELLGELASSVRQPSPNEVFALANKRFVELSRDGLERQFSFAGAPSSSGFVGGGSQSLAVVRRSGGHAKEHGFAPIARIDARFEQSPSDGPSADPGLLTERLFRRAGEVTRNKVVRVDVESFHGPVYNLQTATGYYSSNGIVTHNCRCSMVAVLDTGEPPRSLNGHGTVRLVELAELFGVKAQ